MPRNVKLKIYKTLILAVLAYGAESWIISVADKNLLLVFERKILGMIFDPVCDPDGWSSRFNDGLCQMYRDKNIVSKIHQQELR